MTTKTKSSNYGGKRPGSGRKKGATAKITAMVLLDEFNKQFGKSFEQVLVEQMKEAIEAKDTKLAKEYLQLMSNKVIADKIEQIIDQDITSNGQTLLANINIFDGGSTL